MFKKIICVILALCTLLPLVGCGSSETPEEALFNMFTALGKCDYDTVRSYTDFDAIDAYAAPYMLYVPSEYGEYIYGKSTYEIVSLEKSDNGYVATVNINAPELYELNIDYYLEKEYLTADTIRNQAHPHTDAEIEIMMSTYVADLFSTRIYPTVTNTITLNLIKGDGSWRVEMSKELIYALLGNIPVQDHDLETA